MDNNQDYKTKIERMFSIINDHHETVPFKLNIPQTKVLQSLAGKDIILKARQEGISSLILALFTIDFMYIENVRCVVISHEQQATKRLFERVRFYLDSVTKNHPELDAFSLKNDSANLLVNEYKNSTFYIGTAGQKAFGRGDTIHDLHISELAMWQNEEKVLTGLLQAVPASGKVIIETTANGIGDYFHSLWVKSNSPEKAFTPHFLAWFDDPKYELPIIGGFAPTEEENELANKYKLSHEQLNWRRMKIREFNDNTDNFNQEFPATAEDAFIVSGNPIWPPTTIKKLQNRCIDPIKVGNLVGAYETFVEENEKGYLKLWKEPVVGHSYVIGADVALGIEVPVDAPRSERRDYSCGVVMDRNTAEIVAVWHGHVAGDIFGRELDLLGHYYNDAFIGVEHNYQGLAPLLTLRDRGYPRIYYMEKLNTMGQAQTDRMGWKTDRFTKPLMVEEGSRWLREDRLLIYDKDLVGEMKSFVRYPDGQGGAASNAFDDRVMSLLICIQMYIRNPMTTGGNPIEKSDNDTFGSDDPGTPLDLPQEAYDNGYGGEF